MGWRDLFKRAERGGASGWQAWAVERGWAYEEPADHLVGRFYPALADRRHEEEYHFSVTGAHGALEFVLFSRTTVVRVHRDPGIDRTLNLAVRLPRTPRADLRAMSPEKAFTSLGGHLSGRFGFDSWQGDWMVGACRQVEPYEVEGTLQQIDTQLAFAPPETWEP
jgi:hypothetical protein